MKSFFPIIILCYFLFSCSKNHIKYPSFDVDKIPTAPDYANMKYWASHPNIEDMGDLVPGKLGELQNKQDQAEVDVFFIYPTIYSKKQQSTNPWIADVNNKKLNEDIDETTIKYQATVFNGSAKVYAPRYRQAHINVYYPKRTTEEISQAALDLAYTDVKKAFEHYLKHFNSNRPIIIGSHSQGTTHAIRLIKEFFDQKPLNEKLVAAYIVGMPVKRDVFNSIYPCEDSKQTGCWVGWNTYASDYYPDNHESRYEDKLNVNPINWTTDTTYAEYSLNHGGVLRNYQKIIPGLSDAQNHQGMLWINKLQFFGNFLINWDRYHRVDYNLFYMNIRENIADRVETFLSSH